MNGYNGLGNAFGNNNQYDSARIYFYKALSIDPKFAFSYLGIGNTFFKQKEYDSAMPYYRTVITLDSLNLNAYTFLSACLFLKNNIDSSAYYLKQILNNKIADQLTYKIGGFISEFYEGKKMFDTEIEITRLLYNYDSVYHIPGVDSIQRRNLLNNLAFAYLNTGKDC